MNTPTMALAPQTIVSRAEAVASGRTTYFTGKMCKNGHIYKRNTKARYCLKCVSDHRAKRDKANPDARRARDWKRRKIQAPTRPCPDHCEICNSRPTGKGRAGNVLYLDHEHSTGDFRGWLCSRCNTALGKLGDTSDGIMRAIVYLVRAGS